MYNQPTEGYPLSQQPYQQPPAGGSYPPPPPQPGQFPLPGQFPPQVPPQPKKRSPGCTIAMVCLVLFLVCGACGGIMNALHLNTDTQASSNMNAGGEHSQSGLQKATQTPTHTPTPKPTHTATPTPKPTPTATPTPTDTPAPTDTPTPDPTDTPTPAQTTGVNGNPWGYDFVPGNYILQPPAEFCSYFSCIKSFWGGSGYVVECNDGMYSRSGGRTGSCSLHKGEMRPLYSHAS